MKKTSIKQTRNNIIMLIAMVLCVGISRAQGPNSGSISTNPDSTTSPVPVDGGLSIVLAASLGYGVKKIREQRRKNKGESEGKGDTSLPI